jgi:hypothetical protein
MYAFCQDMPGISLESHEQLTALIPPEALAKCLAHVVGPIDSGTRMIDVWESEADYRQFQKQHLYPALATLQADQPLTDTRGVAPFSVLEVTGTDASATARLSSSLRAEGSPTRV